MMHKFFVVTFMLSLGLMASTTVRAENAAQSSSQSQESQSGMAYQKNASQIMTNLKQNCRSDINTFCNGIKPGEGRIAACLESRQDQLSSQCKETWISAKEAVSKRIDWADVAFRKQCGNDVQKFCSDVPSGKGRLLGCLSDHQSELSKSCKTFQAKLDQKLDEFMS